jgi:DNA-binding MurR/RpiR family transcriptional regulator
MSDEWVVRKTAQALRPGDRFIFTEEMGGEGEVVTVVSLADTYGIAVIETEELDFAIEAMSHQWLTIAPEEEEEDG